MEGLSALELDEDLAATCPDTELTTRPPGALFPARIRDLMPAWLFSHLASAHLTDLELATGSPCSVWLCVPSPGAARLLRNLLAPSPSTSVALTGSLCPTPWLGCVTGAWPVMGVVLNARECWLASPSLRSPCLSFWQLSCS